MQLVFPLLIDPTDCYKVLTLHRLIPFMKEIYFALFGAPYRLCSVLFVLKT